MLNTEFFPWFPRKVSIFGMVMGVLGFLLFFLYFLDVTVQMFWFS